MRGPLRSTTVPFSLEKTRCLRSDRLPAYSLSSHAFLCNRLSMGISLTPRLSLKLPLFGAAQGALCVLVVAAMVGYCVANQVSRGLQLQSLRTIPTAAVS